MISELEAPGDVRPLRRTVIVPPAEVPTFNLGELWHSRHILEMLVWRAIRVRYKQTVIGAAWAILQPFLLMIVFSVFFGRLLQVPSAGLPYPVFIYSAMTIWQTFARAVSEGSAAVAMNPHLVTKIYFPRLYLPLAAILAALVDLGFGLVALVPLMIYYQVAPGWPVVLLPLVILLSVVTAAGAAFFLAALYAIYRDVAHLLPFLIQVWMFASPVLYPGSLVPVEWRQWFALNPMATVIDAGRWCMLGADAPDPTAAVISTAVALVLLVGGYCFFRRREAVMSDLV